MCCTVLRFLLRLVCSQFCYIYIFVFFFFKQKTAYEMRISDWSSDVCSSDLAAAPQRQVDAALAAFPGARFNSYRLPERTGDAAMVHLAMPDGRLMRDVFVSPRGEVLGSIAPDRRLMAWVRSIHGQLLLGKRGSWLVELAASWAIVLVDRAHV